MDQTNNATITTNVIIDNKKKWKCTQCTYENWPSAIKCTICLSNKTQTVKLKQQLNNNKKPNKIKHSKIRVIKLKDKQINNEPNDTSSNSSSDENINDLNQQNDIYQIGQLLNSDLVVSQAAQPEVPIASQSIEKQKWSCHVCTYLNWPKSAKCVQCYTTKTNDILIDVPSTQNDSDKKISNLNEQLQQQLIINTQNTRSSCSSPCTVPKQEQKQQLNGEIELNEPLTQETVIESKKWSCSGCTYQNWPKSQRCVMCHLQRNNPNKKQIDYQQKLKTYQMQLDRLFLAACQGIVDDDMSHLNRYINANGDLTRYLTTEEVKLLNRPKIFTVGLTILHLCYQFKRKEFLMQILSSNSTNTRNKKLSQQNSSLSSSTMNLLNALLKQVNKTKFSPCQSCPALASNIIERYFSASLRQRKTPNHYHYLQRQHDHHLHISPTSSLISLNQQQQTNLLTTNSSSIVNLAQQQQCSNVNTQAFLTISPSPSPPPSVGATSIYYQQSQSLCFYVNECHTFILPNEIDDFSPRIQHILFDELLDREVQQELENESRVINWNIDLCKRLDSRLYPLWNRHSGDCLLDSVLQACYGVFDTDNTLRRIMAESLEQYANCFKPRWKEHEILMAQSLDYTLDDYQLEQDWNNIISLANQPGASLEQAHIFALCHIFRRPIIIYSIKYVKSFRGENIGFTHFEGVYLPLIWEANFCFKSPIALGYTRGHFTALVPLERSEVINYNADLTTNATTNNTNDNSNSSNMEAGAVSSQIDYIEQQNNQQVFYLPLANSEGQLLPIHFLNSSELGRERTILRQYLNLDCLVMPGNNCGLFVAQQRVGKFNF